MPCNGNSPLQRHDAIIRKLRVQLAGDVAGHGETLLATHLSELGGVSTGHVSAHQRSRLSEVAVRGIPDFANDLVGKAHAAEDLVFIRFPKTLVSLPAYLADR